MVTIDLCIHLLQWNNSLTKHVSPADKCVVWLSHATTHVLMFLAK